MSQRGSIKTPNEFFRLLEESSILRGAELRAARAISRKTSTGTTLARRLVKQQIITRWQAGQLLSGLTKLRLGNYKLCQQVRRGPFGRVFVAEHIQLHRTVAIETLSRRFARNTEIVNQFLDDARNAAALNHRNLVHVLDIDSAGDHYYMVMEYVVGQDLQDIVAQTGPLPPVQAVDYLSQAAAGLHYAHRAGLVHGGICPANLMLNERGVIKVLGWGMGRLAEHIQASGETEYSERGEDQVLYRAPEYRSGTTVANVIGDIFSLGASGVFLITGQPLGEMGHGAVDDRPPGGESEINWDVVGVDPPAALADLLGKMTVAERQSRFATLQPVCDALHELRESLTETAGLSATPPPPMTGFRPRAEATAVDESAEDGAGDPLSSSPEAATESSGLQGRWRLGRYPVRTLATIIAAGGIMLMAVACLFWSDYLKLPLRGARTPQRDATREDAKPARSRPELVARHRRTRATEAGTSFPEVGAGHEPPRAIEKQSTDDPTGIAPSGKPSNSNVSPTAVNGEADGAAGSDAEGSSTSESSSRADDVADSEQRPQADQITAEDQLQELPTAIDLPPFGATDEGAAESQPVQVACISASFARKLDVRLLGGEHASARAARFSIQSRSEQGEPGWTVWLTVEEGTGENKVPVAEFHVRDGELRFWWKAAVSRYAQAAYLCNCVLRFTFQDATRDVFLRTVAEVGPLSVDLQRASLKRQWTLESLPDREHVHFEITRLEDPFPHVYNLSPLQPVVAHEERVSVLLGSKELEDHVVKLELCPELRSTFHLNCKVYFRVTPRIDWIPLTQERIEAAAHFVANKQRADKLRTWQTQLALSRLPRQDPGRKALEKKCKMLDAQREETNRAAARLKTLRHIRSAMAAGAALHFRLYYLTDGCEVNLLRTAPSR